MNDQDIHDLSLWFGMQPGYTSFNEVKNFISEHMDVPPATAEVEIAGLVSQNEIVVVETFKADEDRRVFLTPLDDLSEDDVRQVFDMHGEMKLESLIRSIHDNTGHDTQDIDRFVRDLDNATILGDSFSWDES